MARGPAGSPPFVQCLSFPHPGFTAASFLTGHLRLPSSHQQALPQGARGLLLEQGLGQPLLCSQLSCSFYSTQSKSQMPVETSGLPAGSWETSGPAPRAFLISPSKWPSSAQQHRLSLGPQAQQRHPLLRTPVVLFHLNLAFDSRGLPSAQACPGSPCIPYAANLLPKLTPCLVPSCVTFPLEFVTTDMPKAHPLFSFHKSPAGSVEAGMRGAWCSCSAQHLVDTQLLLKKWKTVTQPAGDTAGGGEGWAAHVSEGSTPGCGL